jgi:ABC-type multidrug transport system ATPase subunit/ABC-type multidrug transport system permease subunit
MAQPFISEISEKCENILQWSNLTISTKNNDRLILDNISGQTRSGESLAIMGSSGAGKTTFLNYLSKRFSSSTGLKKVSGEIKFIHNNIDQTLSLQQLSGYVTQDDILYEVLTPRELFHFAADMKLVNLSRISRKEKVEKLILQLGLEKCADTRVGDVMIKGLSGGEKKRTAIGYELITEPKILFLDEPTTGLDSINAMKVIKLITDEARENNRIIIFTIHQPSSEIFHLFDKLMLLASGKVVYCDKAVQAIEYFGKLNYSCPSHFNPAEFFIKILSKENKIVESLETDWKKIKKRKISIKEENFNENNDKIISRKSSFCSSSMDSSLILPQIDEKYIQEYEQQITNLSNIYFLNQKLSDLNSYPKNNSPLNLPKNNIFKEFLILFSRNMKTSLRGATAYMLRISMTILNCLLVILVFNNLGKGENAVQDRNGCLFFLTSSVVNANLQMNLMTFTIEKPKFYKEQESKMYGVLPYFLSKTILEIPLQVVLSIISFFVTYFLAGLSTNSFENYFIFILTIFLTGYTGSTFAVFLSSLFDRKEILPAIFPFLLYTQLQASGYLSALDNIPYVFYPFKYISVFRYCYQALAWNEYRDLTPEMLECKVEAKCRFPTDEFPENLNTSLIISGGLALAMNILAVFALKIKVWFRKN